MCYNLYHGTLELAEIWNLGNLVVSLFICTINVSLFSQLRNKSPNLGQRLFLNTQVINLGQREYQEATTLVFIIGL